MCACVCVHALCMCMCCTPSMCHTPWIATPVSDTATWVMAREGSYVFAYSICKALRKRPATELRGRALSRETRHATASQKAEIDNANASLRQMYICTRSNVARCEEMNGGGRGRLKTAQAHRPDAARLPPGGTHGPPESLGGQPRAAGGPSPRPSQRRLCPASAPRAGCGGSWSARGRGPPLERGRAQCGRAATIRTR